MTIKYVTPRIVADIERERQRQEELREAGKFTHSCSTRGITDATCTRVLQEEVDEVLDEADELRRSMAYITRTMNDHAKNEPDAPDTIRPRLRKELIEVMSVACAWIERFDSQDDGILGD